MFNRRSLLVSSTGLFAAASLPNLAYGATKDPRFIVIILRGALDGLNAAPPIGDPGFSSLRPPAFDAPPLELDAFFGLHPAMKQFHRLYLAKQASLVHAVATPYRDRSHFDGQDVLESGLETPGFADTGWLNRLILSLGKGEKLGAEKLGAQKLGATKGLSVGSLTPLVIRGQAPTLGWSPKQLKSADPDLAPRLLRLYEQSDPLLYKSLMEGIETGKIADSLMGSKVGTSTAQPNVMLEMAKGAAALMKRDDGPRIAAMAFDGWDTHFNQKGRLNSLLSGLDGAFGAFESGLGEAWGQTVVVALTEFGRTARFNGTLGSDHGQASVAFMAGGALAGGKILADWPGLKTSDLYEGRDLAPTTDLRSVLMGIARDHLGADPIKLSRDVFPASLGLKPTSGLIA